MVIVEPGSAEAWGNMGVMNGGYGWVGFCFFARGWMDGWVDE